jgi:xanthine dehydrogenase large subunit
MQNLDSHQHVRGESVYLDDIPVQQGTLYAAVYDSPVAHGIIDALDFSAAEAYPGVVRILTYHDIPGENQIGGIVPDEPALAEHHVHFRGQPVALVLAETDAIARHARTLIKADISLLPIITDPREAAEKGEFIVPPRTFRCGDVTAAWGQCAHIIEGVAESGGQEHLYLETQGAYGYPTEHGSIRLYSSTQGPTAVQRHAARVLGVGMNHIEVDVTRLGGGFGGKEDQATPWGVLVALAVHVLRRPVKLVLHRLDDLRMTGKRHPYSSDYRIGFDENLKIIAYEADFYQNAGASADLSPAVLERTLFHCTNTYAIPNVRATARSCRTNLPPNTAFRGFGGPQGMYVIEAALAHAAETLGVPKRLLQERNLLQDGDVFPYGQVAEQAQARACWHDAVQRFDLNKIEADAAAFNAANRWKKRGVSLMPICFGISFTKTLMNQGRALVHVYMDGTVGVSTGAVEMGQGVNTKMAQVAARVLGIPVGLIKLEPTNTTRVANTSPSAASATADLNGKAVEMAAMAIRTRLIALAARESQCEPELVELLDQRVVVSGAASAMSWENLVGLAYVNRVALSEHAHYATPRIHFDPQTESGHPFAYHVFGTAITVATVDCVRGTYELDAVHISHDFGTSMNTAVDLGQIEGGLVQGIGWMTMEDVIYNAEGRLLANALSTYKIPDIYSVPRIVDIHFLPTPPAELAVFGSKAVGEPPLMYGIGAWFALREAVRAFNPSAKLPFVTPMTPERVLTGLYAADPAQVEEQVEAEQAVSVEAED